MQFRCPNCEHAIEVAKGSSDIVDKTDVLTCPSCQNRISFSDETTVESQPLVGVRIGQFELQQVLGEGAFGTVYRGWDTELQRIVAIKIPRQDKVRADAGRHFLREARAAARVQHPNVVQVHEVGQFGTGYYIVSEFIDGISLAEWLKDRPLTDRQIAELMHTICEGVRAAHTSDVTHRDLKPANIMMDRQARPHVADFGLARHQPGESLMTQDGRIIGTPSYMSPEQARGENATITRRSDVWSLGVMLYEMLTRRKPFAASDMHTVFYRILNDEPTAPNRIRRTIPKDLATIALHAMEKNPASRYADAGEMAEDLQRFLDHRPILAKPAGILRRSVMWLRRNRLAAALTGVAIPAVVMALALALRPAPPPVEAEEPKVAVQMECQLLGSMVPPATKVRWAAARLDPKTRQPGTDNVLRYEGSKWSAQLVPGEYLIAVEASDYGFHEVYRTVPESVDQANNLLFDHLSSKALDDTTVLLPTVQIRESRDVVSDMVLITGGQFEMGDDHTESLRFKTRVSDFFLDATEVTVQAYRTWSQEKAGRGTIAVSNVSWHEAAAFAEFFGKRLPTEAEFEYAATNQGTTVYPSGDRAVQVEGVWTYEAAGMPVEDRCRNYPVFGLHSNVAEWTDSLLTPYPSMPPWPAELIKMANIPGSRVVRGGPVSAGRNERADNTWLETPKHREAWSVSTEDDEIGFRCARSRRPRLLED